MEKKPRKSSAPEIKLTPTEQDQLQGWASSRTMPFGLVQHSQVILVAAAGKQNLEIAEDVGMSPSNVGKWRQACAALGISGLYDLPRSSRPRSIEDERIAELQQATLQRKPEKATHWSMRQLEKESGVSKSTIQCIWSAFGLKPHLK